MLAAPARHPSTVARPRVSHARRHRRLGYRLASGLTPAQAARAEGLPEAEVASLLADPAFTALVEACRALEARPDDEARRRLISLARFVLEEALAEGDVRAALFVLRQEERGRDPARVLVDGVLSCQQRAATPPAPPASPPRPAAPRASRNPVDRSLERVAARLRDELAAERLAAHLATAAEAPAPTPVAKAAVPVVLPRTPPNRREHRRSAALARQRRPSRDPPRST